MSLQAFYELAFLTGAFQAEAETENWAFQQCVFQYDAFQAEFCDHPVPEPSGGGGGGGHPGIYWQGRRKKREYKSVDNILAGMYADLTKQGGKEAQKEAVAVVREFTESKAVKPRVTSIDWNALERDVEKVQALLKLWSDEAAAMQEEEDMVAILLLMEN